MGYDRSSGSSKVILSQMGMLIKSSDTFLLAIAIA